LVLPLGIHNLNWSKVILDKICDLTENARHLFSSSLVHLYDNTAQNLLSAVCGCFRGLGFAVNVGDIGRGSSGQTNTDERRGV
jgi:hypothetical protein